MRALGSFTLPVEAIKVTEFSRAVRWEQPGVPPTFTAVAAHYAPPGRSANELVIEAAGLTQRRVLLGSMWWSCRRALEVGDRLTGSVFLTGCRTSASRSGRELRIATGETSWVDASGARVVTVGVTLIEPSGAGEPAAGVPDPGEAGDGAVMVSRTDIVRYAGAAGDFNPVHHDAVAARALGYPDVFAMGLLPAGILASAAARTLGPLTSLAARFHGLIWPGVAYLAEIGQPGPELSLSLRDPRGSTVLSVTATGGGST